MDKPTSSYPATTAALEPATAIGSEPPGAPIGFVEFVLLVAALMSLTALGIDSMLPALPAIVPPPRGIGALRDSRRPRRC